MSSISSAASADSHSDSNEPECTPLPSAKRTSESGPSSPATGRTSPASPMWRRYQEIASADSQSTWLPEASHAKTYLTLDDVPGLKGSAAGYGLTSAESFAYLSPSSPLWKTSQACFLGEWARYSRTWPQAGTTRNGTAYRLRPLAPRTYERASGFLPTPVASETKRTTPYSQGGQSLSYILRGRPSQRLLEWMMGFPAGWLEPPVTRSSRKSSKRLAEQL